MSRSKASRHDHHYGETVICAEVVIGEFTVSLVVRGSESRAHDVRRLTQSLAEHIDSALPELMQVVGA